MESDKSLRVMFLYSALTAAKDSKFENKNKTLEVFEPWERKFFLVR